MKVNKMANTEYPRLLGLGDGVTVDSTGITLMFCASDATRPTGVGGFYIKNGGAAAIYVGINVTVGAAKAYSDSGTPGWATVADPADWYDNLTALTAAKAMASGIKLASGETLLLKAYSEATGSNQIITLYAITASSTATLLGGPIRR